MSISCTVDGREVHPTSLTRREMNFGQGCPGLPKHAWSITVDVREFMSIVRPLYGKLLKELIEDHEHDPEDVETKDLAAQNWPTFERLFITDADLVIRILRRFLVMELLDALLPHRHVDMRSSAYAIDSVESLTKDDSVVRLTGIAYPLHLNLIC